MIYACVFISPEAHSESRYVHACSGKINLKKMNVFYSTWYQIVYWKIFVIYKLCILYVWSSNLTTDVIFNPPKKGSFYLRLNDKKNWLDVANIVKRKFSVTTIYIAFFTFKNYLELKLKTTEVANFKLFFFFNTYLKVYTQIYFKINQVYVY